MNLSHAHALALSALVFAPIQAQADAHGPVSSVVEFGPCTEFIGGFFVSEDAARQVVPETFELDVGENGVVGQVRAINCQSISITDEAGNVTEAGQHILYQLGAAVLPVADLDPHPMLEGAAEITEYHAYAFNTVTNLAPLAEALENAGIGGVQLVEGITFDTGDDNPNSCDLVPVSGSIPGSPELGLSFNGMVRDLGLEPEDGCVFGEGDITVSERAVWYTDGPFGPAMSDTAVPNSQRLLFNADPETYAPLAVGFAPTGDVMQSISGAEIAQFSFTMSGLLERGEVFTILRPITE
ncbi:MAG: hypothetical protein AAGA70_14720 [Pseudomonadota bacterium]